MDFIKIAKVSDLEGKKYKSFTVFSKKLAVFKNSDGTFYAMETNCRHQNADLLGKKPSGDVVKCPRHGWRYNLKTGECLDHAWAGLRRFELKIENGDIYVSTRPIESEDEDN